MRSLRVKRRCCAVKGSVTADRSRRSRFPRVLRRRVAVRGRSNRSQASLRPTRFIVALAPEGTGRRRAAESGPKGLRGAIRSTLWIGAPRPRGPRWRSFSFCHLKKDRQSVRQRGRQIPNREKPRVLHGNDRLRRREILKQRDLLIGEWAYLMSLVCSAT